MDKNRKFFLAGIVGNILDRYDTALYGLLVIYITPSFFPNDDLVVGMIKTFAISFVGILTRPLGAAFFGKIAISDGPKSTLAITLLGVAISTFIIGFIPPFSKIGYAAPILLVISRALLGFFAAGEAAVSAFFVLNNVSKDKFTRTSSLYNFSTMFGVMIASFTAYIITLTDNPHLNWRYAFIFGFFTAIVGIWLRSMTLSHYEEKKRDISLPDIVKMVFENRITIIKIIFITSFSYMTYTIPFVFMNKFIPQITDISFKQMIKYNSILLVFDTFLLPLIGFAASKFRRSEFMGVVSAILTITIVPLFILLPKASITYVLFVRIWIIILGLCFLAPIQPWYYEQFKGDERYILGGISYQLGAEIFGRNSTAICLSLWLYTGSSAAPAAFFAFIGLCASFILLTERKAKKIQKE